MKRAPKTPQDLGCQVYRGYVYRRVPASKSGRTYLWTGDGEFVCQLMEEDVRAHIDRCIGNGWHTRQLELI